MTPYRLIHKFLYIETELLKGLLAQFGALALVVAAVFVLSILLAVNSPQGNFVLKTFVDKIPSINNKDIQQEVKSTDGLLGDSVKKENQNEESTGRPRAEISNGPGTRTDLTPPEPSFNPQQVIEIPLSKSGPSSGGGANE